MKAICHSEPRTRRRLPLCYFVWRKLSWKFLTATYCTVLHGLDDVFALACRSLFFLRHMDICSAAYLFHRTWNPGSSYRVHTRPFSIVGLKCVACRFASAASLRNAQLAANHMKGWFPNSSEWCRCFGRYVLNKPRSFTELLTYNNRALLASVKETHMRKKPVDAGERPNHLGPAVCEP